jgi:NADH dehydrogenase
MNAAPSPQKVLVAGGTGFLGAAIVRELAARGHRVDVLSRHPGGVAARFPGLEVGARGGDVTDPSTLPPALDGIDVVVQTVQFPGFPVEDVARGRTFRDVDARGTANVVEAAGETEVRRVIYLSGVGADPDSDRTWFRAKAMAEAAVSRGDPAFTILRPSWVYGPEDQSLNIFARLVRLVPGVFPQLGAGDQRINPVWVGDLAAAVADSLEVQSAIGATFEIGGPVTYTMDGIIHTLMDAMGRRKPIVHLPMGLLRFGAALAELVPGQLFSRDALEFATGGAVADLSSLRRVLPDAALTAMPEALGRYEPGRRR